VVIAVLGVVPKLCARVMHSIGFRRSNRQLVTFHLLSVFVVSTVAPLRAVRSHFPVMGQNYISPEVTSPA